MKFTKIKLNEEKNEKSIIIIGNFDGIHLGHNYLIENLENDENLSKSVVIFNPHTKNVILNTKVDVLTPIREKIRLFKKLDLDQIFIIHFTKSVSQMKWNDFLSKIIEEMNVSEIILCEDFKFGKDGEGNSQKAFEFSKTKGVLVKILKRFDKSDKKISSGTIRSFIKNDKIEDANEILGRKFSISGYVYHGLKNGRKIGFPTANTSVRKDLCIPNCGVYAVEVEICETKEKFFGLCNIGFRPTVVKNSELTIETHILNFDRDIYGKRLNLEFVKKIRNEIKFNSIDELKLQIHRDKETVVSIFFDY